MIPGDRVTLMDPGPMARGTVIEHRGHAVWMECDYGKRRWAQASLLVVIAPSPVLPAKSKEKE